MRPDRTDTYVYVDADGRKVFQRVRWERPDGTKEAVTYEHGVGAGWLHSAEETQFQVQHGKLATRSRTEVIFDTGDGVKGKPSVCPACIEYDSPGVELSESVLYKLPELIAGLEAADVIYITEGESDANAMAESTGECATTHPRGVSGPTPAQVEWFRDYEGQVIIIADNDDGGYSGALYWYDALTEIDVYCIVQRPPKEYKDIREYLESEPPSEEDGVLALQMVELTESEMRAAAKRYRGSDAEAAYSGHGWQSNEPLGEWHTKKQQTEKRLRDQGKVVVKKDIKPKPETYDDQGNAGLLLRFYHDDVRYVRDRAVWAAWDHEREIWVMGNDSVLRKWDDITRRMQRLFEVKYLPLIGTESDNEADARAFGKHVTYSRNEGRAASVLSAASRRVQVIASDSEFDADMRILACENGVLKLCEDGNVPMVDAGKDYYITMTTGVNYVEEAWQGNGCGSMWDKFLCRLLPDVEVRNWVQRLVGYSMLGANPERKVVCVLGPTSSGKTTFAEIMRTVLGGYASAMSGTVFRDNQDERPRADIIKVLNKRFVVSEEMSGSWHLHTDQIKRLAGGGTVIARVPYAPEPVERMPAFTPWFIANDPPTIKDADLALWRRIVVVPFDVSLPESEVDSGLKDKLIRDAENREEILAWAIEGWKRYCSDGLEVPGSIAEAQMRFREDVSDFDRWMRDCCERDEEYREQPGTLFDSYQDWCEVNNIPPRDRLSSVLFGKRLSGLGVVAAVTREGGKTVRYRNGLRLKPRSGNASV